MPKIRFDRTKPMASVEFVLQSAVAGHGVQESKAHDPAHIEPVLASAEFKGLVEAVRCAFHEELADSKFEVLRISGIVCHHVDVYHPGLLLILQERDRTGTITQPERERITGVAESVRQRLGIA